MNATWALALELEHFIRDFVPPGWTCSIEHCMFVPVVFKQDITAIKIGRIPEKFSNPAIKLAIRAWLLKGKDNGKVQSQ